MKNHHLVVISVDVMVTEDLELLSTLPNFKEFISKGSRINRIHTVYPSLTHPVHASIITGCTPGKTGIVNNNEFAVGELNHTWFNHLNQIQCPTIFHAAHRAGLTSAASRWPLTAGGGDVIDYIVPEIMDKDLVGTMDIAEVYKNLGSSPIMDDIVLPNLPILNNNLRPNYDEFSVACTVDIIKKYKPNLIFTHLGMVDAARHENGLFNDRVDDALCLTDKWLGDIVDALETAGISEETDIIVLSDHGHLEVERMMCLNVFLVNNGFIRLGEKGEIIDWDAYIMGGGLSAQVFLNNPNDLLMKSRVYDLLMKMAGSGIYGFSEVLTSEEVNKRYGLYGDFSFVIETDGFTAFHDDWLGPAVRYYDESDYKYGHSQHGHMPHKRPQPPFLVVGPSFKSQIVIEEGSILDECPTFARIFGLSLGEIEGMPILALFK